VLVGLRDYQDEKADVIMKYTADEVSRTHVTTHALDVAGSRGVVCCMAW
jgi:hypothetical protein